MLEAISRQDEDEVERLGRSCPREAWKIADPAYTDLLDQSHLTAACFAIWWLGTAQD